MKKMKILVTGGSGVVGEHLLKKIQSRYDIYSPSSSELNITNKTQVQNVFKEYRPDILLHLAAFRNATEAEKERGNKKGLVYSVNVIGTRNIASACAKFKTKPIYISSGFVFSGDAKTPGPYTEDDRPESRNDKLSWYGITKRDGEKIIKKVPGWTILRIDNVTEPGNTRDDYIGKILKLYSKGIYPMFNNQSITIAEISKMAKSIHKIIQKNAEGIFHIASSNIFTPHELASYAFNKAFNITSGIPSSDIDEFLKKHPGRYPKHGGLSTKKTSVELGLKFDSWQKIVDRFIEKANT